MALVNSLSSFDSRGVRSRAYLQSLSCSSREERRSYLDQVEHIDRSSVSVKEVVEMQSRGRIKRVDEVYYARERMRETLRLTRPTFDWGFWRHPGGILSPEYRDAATMLNIGCVVPVRIGLWSRRMKRRREHVRDDLLRFHIVRHVALIILAWGEEMHRRAIPGHWCRVSETGPRQSNESVSQLW